MPSGRSTRVAPDPWAEANDVDGLDDIENILSDLETIQDESTKRSASKALTDSAMKTGNHDRAAEGLPSARVGEEDKYEARTGDSVYQGNNPNKKKKHSHGSRRKQPSSTHSSQRALSNVLSDEDDISPLEIVYAQEDPSLKKDIWSHDPAPPGRFVALTAPVDRTNPTSPASSTPKRSPTRNNSITNSASETSAAADQTPDRSHVHASRRVGSDPTDVGPLSLPSSPYKTTVVDVVQAEEDILDIPSLEARDRLNLDENIIEETADEAVQPSQGSWYTRWKAEKSERVKKNVRVVAAKQGMSDVRSSVSERVESQKQTVVGGLVRDVVGTVNPLSSKCSVGVFETAQAYVAEEGYGAEKYTVVQALFAAEDQKIADLDTLMIFAAAHDKSFGDNMKKGEVMKVLMRRKAWKWKPVTMTGVLVVQLMLSLAALSTYRNPLNLPLTGLLFLFVVAAALSNKYRNTTIVLEKLNRIRDVCLEKYGTVVFLLLVMVFIPVWGILILLPVLFDLLVGSVKDYSYGGMMKLLVNSVVTCTALSIGVRATSPLDAVQTFAGFAFISEMDEAVLYKMSFDPCSDYFPVKEKEAAYRKVFIYTLLSIVVPLYAVVVLIITVSEYFCVFCWSM